MSIYLGMIDSKGNIVEENNLSDFLDDNDFSIIFFDMLRDFPFEKNPGLKRNINMSYLFKNYLEDFIKHYDLDADRLRYSSSNKYPEIIGRKLYDKGLYDLHIHTPEKKFTEKYGRILNYLINRLNIPPHLKIDVVEDIPNVLDFKVTVPYPEIVKSTNDNNADSYRSFFPNSYAISFPISKLFKEIQQFLNVHKGNPTTGGVELNVSNELLNREEWTKQFLKDLRTRIKSNPEISEKIKSVKLSTKGINNTIDLVLTNPSQYESWSQRTHKRKEIQDLFDYVKEQINSFGLNNGYFSIDSPTWRKNF